jgi:hypothetical protein
MIVEGQPAWNTDIQSSSAFRKAPKRHFTEVYHYRDSSGLEVDSIVQKYNGDCCAFEIKLGTGQFDEAVVSLNKLVSILDTRKIKPPKSLNIITGTGISYTRNDGINVISLASLGSF